MAQELQINTDKEKEVTPYIASRVVFIYRSIMIS